MARPEPRAVMDLAEYKKRYEENNDVGPGWDAIGQQVERLYPGQEPVHFTSNVHAALGGADPLDGVSVYASNSGENSGKKNSWPVQVMQNLGRYVNKSQKWFEEFHFIDAGGPIRTVARGKSSAGHGPRSHVIVSAH